MPNAPTPILGLTIPTVGGDVNSWGAELNADLALLDALGAAQVISINSSVVLSLTGPLTVLLISSGATGVTITLPTAIPNQSRIVLAKKIDQGIGAAILAPASGQIDGGPNYQLVNYLQRVILAPDSANWWAFS